MIEAQKWLLQLCIACILVSVISNFIKNEKVNISIKSVLVLYILVITLNSVLGVDVKQMQNKQLEKIEISSTINSDDLVKKNAEQSLCNQINEKLGELDVNSVCKAVSLNISEGTVDEVTLSALDDEAIKAVKELLGEEIAIVAEKEG